MLPHLPVHGVSGTEIVITVMMRMIASTMVVV
jgi:hypothetical protein